MGGICYYEHARDECQRAAFQSKSVSTTRDNRSPLLDLLERLIPLLKLYYNGELVGH